MAAVNPTELLNKMNATKNPFNNNFLNDGDYELEITSVFEGVSQVKKKTIFVIEGRVLASSPLSDERPQAVGATVAIMFSHNPSWPQYYDQDTKAARLALAGITLADFDATMAGITEGLNSSDAAAKALASEMAEILGARLAEVSSGDKAVASAAVGRRVGVSKTTRVTQHNKRASVYNWRPAVVQA